MKKLIVALFFLLFYSCISAQDIDVLHYQFNIELSDENDSIKGVAIIEVKALKPASSFFFDLVQQGVNGKGMNVEAVDGEKVMGFHQSGDKIYIQLTSVAKENAVYNLQIRYSGIPADGLIISKNKYGDRTFFADNWPNRAHHWIPCNDKPDDKASVEFKIIAPLKYQVISNGILKEKTNIQQNKILTHWVEDIAIPTKVMVIGAAQFAIGTMDTAVNCVPVTAWVYPQDKDKGFFDYALSTSILNFFSEYIGPYPYKKLANVQSKTIFGGMENASSIFYAENTVTGNRKSEDLIAHEIVHQWFGDMVTEKNFSHLWLSEGFATYLANIYLEKKYGRELFQNRLLKDRDMVINFERERNSPVLDSTHNLMELLNANSYQKGSWVLHMLRTEVGDSVFHTIIKKYYSKYKGGNAETADFIKVAEETSGKNLEPFFKQWLYNPGLPHLKAWWNQLNNGQIRLSVEQMNSNAFQFPLELRITYKNGKSEIKNFEIKDAFSSFDVPVTGDVIKVQLDPNVRLLFDGAIHKSK